MPPTIIPATVKYAAGQPRDTQYGPRINVVCTPAEGDDIKLWGNPDDAISHLKKGQSVQILHEFKNGKDSYKLLQAAADLSGPQAEAPALSAEQKQAIAQYIQEQSKLLGYCLQTVRTDENISQLSEDSQRACAMSIYIATQKKFNL